METKRIIESLIKIKSMVGSSADSKKFLAILDDLLPNAFEERKMLRKVVSDEFLASISTICNTTEEEQELCASELKKSLVSNNGINEEWVDYSLNVFSRAYNFIFVCETKQEEKENNAGAEGNANSDIDSSKCFNRTLLIADNNYIVGISNNRQVVTCGSYDYDRDYKKEIEDSIKNWSNLYSLTASGFSSSVMFFGLQTNGNVLCSKAYYNDDKRDMASKWCDIKMISSAKIAKHVVGLKNDGTVVAAGDNQYGQCNTSNWKNITFVQAYFSCTVGVKNDGTVVYTGDKHSLNTFTNIQRMTNQYFIGIRQDGTLAVADPFYDFKYCNPTEWLLGLTNVKDVITSLDYIAVLFNDGHVEYFHKKCGLVESFNSWNNIARICVSYANSEIIGITKQGEILAADQDGSYTTNVHLDNVLFAFKRMMEEWVAVKKDGRVVSFCLERDYKNEVDNWTRVTGGWILDVSDYSIDEVVPFEYKSGSYYIGEWKNGKIDGKGTYYFSTGESISGSFRNGNIYNCEGTFIGKSYTYKGAFVNGKKNGLAKIKYSNGNSFEGEFLADSYLKGTFKFSSGESWTGEFKNDEPWTGEGTWKYKDGKIKSGKWKNGRKKLF